ncbi:MAG: LPS export ABC transporter periplasmic protein LptC [Parvularculaceae bacterium]|nr:LPS export ABC transporter periplasmic protein LptC [Parvularculaceae bacterium]
MSANAVSNDQSRSAPRTATGMLESLTIRRRTTGEAAAARAMLMRRLRIILPAIAVGLIAIFFLNTRSTQSDEAFLNDFANLEATPQSLQTSNLRFSGVDAQGNPYEITAQSTTQRANADKVIDLEKPRAVTAGDAKSSVVEAAAGTFDSQSKLLELDDGVTFEHTIGRDNYVLKTPTATVSIDDQTVVSGEGVIGDGPGGSSLKADAMNANNRNGLIVFEGNVSMRLYPKQADLKQGAAPEDAQTGDDQ